MDIPSARQQQILKWLQDTHTLAVSDLADRFGVSVMTIHRDLDNLSQLGLVEKVHGGVILTDVKPAELLNIVTCRMCEMTVQTRTGCMIQTLDGQQWNACCGHCGLLLMADFTEVQSVLTRDFLYGRVINAFQAAYLMDSDLSVCCHPSVLCFANQDDAERFQKGFSGKIMLFAEAQAYLTRKHRSHSPHD